MLARGAGLPARHREGLFLYGEIEPMRGRLLPSLPRASSALGFLALAGLVAAVAGGCLRSRPEHPGRVTVTYWEKWTGFEGEAMQATVDAFNRSQPRIFVKLLTISQVDQKMILATAGGVPSDVAGLWSYNVNVYADQNALLYLDQYCARAEISREDYIPCYWEMCRHRGHTWALPSTPASVALHWNKQLFREAGLDPERPPTTIEQLDA